MKDNVKIKNDLQDRRYAEDRSGNEDNVKRLNHHIKRYALRIRRLRELGEFCDKELNTLLTNKMLKDIE